MQPSCRSCGGDRLAKILSLGPMPLANALLTREQLHDPEPTYPLELAFCSECALVQITATVPPEKLFREYLYFSSFSDTLLRHAEALVTRLVETRRLNAHHLVVELASNDGYLLQYYQRRAIPVLGVEPARNIADVARDRGIHTISEFFGHDLACKLKDEYGQADVIHANNVLAHVADLNGFVKGIRVLLKSQGVAIVEVPYVKDLIDHVEFDTIYHEHLCYFSLVALAALFGRHGLEVQDVEWVPIHGGSLRLFIGQIGSRASAESVAEFLLRESNQGIDRLTFYADFERRVQDLRVSLRDLLFQLKRQRKRVAGYGAAAKGTTLLNYFEIGPELLDFVVDRSTYKQGRYTPGTHLPIFSPDRLMRENMDYLLLLAWNFASEILEQQDVFRQQGGRFIIPIPALKVI
jgi:SAM-dependent methyltransferase